MNKLSKYVVYTCLIGMGIMSVLYLKSIFDLVNWNRIVPFCYWNYEWQNYLDDTMLAVTALAFGHIIVVFLLDWWHFFCDMLPGSKISGVLETCYLAKGTLCGVLILVGIVVLTL